MRELAGQSPRPHPRHVPTLPLPAPLSRARVGPRARGLRGAKTEMSRYFPYITARKSDKRRARGPWRAARRARDLMRFAFVWGTPQRSGRASDAIAIRVRSAADGHNYSEDDLAVGGVRASAKSSGRWCSTAIVERVSSQVVCTKGSTYMLTGRPRSTPPAWMSPVSSFSSGLPRGRKRMARRGACRAPIRHPRAASASMIAAHALAPA